MRSQEETTEIHTPATHELNQPARLFAELLAEAILEKHSGRKKRSPELADTTNPKKD